MNLIGDHTDYNDGLALPMAVQLECVVAAEPNETGRVHLRSLDAGAPVDVAADGSDDPLAVEPRWGRYVAGVVTALAARGRPRAGARGVLASSVPLGAGLASSAALEVAVAVALCDGARFRLSPRELAIACQEAERAATGVPSGIMDQLASAAARAGHALLIDCRTLASRDVSVPDSVGILVVHSGVDRTLATTAYAERARATRELAAMLGLPSLRDAALADVARHPLGRHVVTENERVVAAADALAAGELVLLGQLFDESHRSLRDDYRVSTAALDALVAALVHAGAYGARLTGAGFGGAVVAVCERDDEDRVAARALPAYRGVTGNTPSVYVVRPAAGAGALAS